MKRVGNHLYLSRSNLLALLAKLDGFPPGSARTIAGGDDAPGFFVTVEEDEEHYAHRQYGRGRYVRDTEERMVQIVEEHRVSGVYPRNPPDRTPPSD